MLDVNLNHFNQQLMTETDKCKTLDRSGGLAGGHLGREESMRQSGGLGKNRKWRPIYTDVQGYIKSM